MYGSEKVNNILGMGSLHPSTGNIQTARGVCALSPPGTLLGAIERKA